LLFSQKAKHLRHFPTREHWCHSYKAPGADKRRVPQKAKHLRHFPTREHWCHSYKTPGADKRRVQQNFTTAFIPRASALAISQTEAQKAGGDFCEGSNLP